MRAVEPADENPNGLRVSKSLLRVDDEANKIRAFSNRADRHKLSKLGPTARTEFIGFLYRLSAARTEPGGFFRWILIRALAFARGN